MSVTTLIIVMWIVTESIRRNRKLRMSPAVGACMACKTPLVGPFCTKCGHDNRLYYPPTPIRTAAELSAARADSIRGFGRMLKWIGIGLVVLAGIALVIAVITLFELWTWLLCCVVIWSLIWGFSSIVSDAVADGVRRGRS